MLVTDQPEELRRTLEKARNQGRTVGFHPTMGALHGGHQANIARAAAECEVVAVTIYVNPLQFGPAEDYDAYPRPLEADLARAEEAGATVVLAPTVRAMFAQGPLTVVHVAELGQLWEGATRPGHFDGVATIVTKLLALAGPCYAYFGEKDYQQLAIIRRLVADLSLPAVIVACTTVREPDGLALSSRNSYLGPEERAAAPSLYWALLAGKRAVEETPGEEAGPVPGRLVRAAMAEVMRRQDQFRLEYADVVDPVTLVPLDQVAGEARLIIAARSRSARLIDNLAANEKEG